MIVTEQQGRKLLYRTWSPERDISGASPPPLAVSALSCCLKTLGSVVLISGP